MYTNNNVCVCVFHMTENEQKLDRRANTGTTAVVRAHYEFNIIYNIPSEEYILIRILTDNMLLNLFLSLG